MKTKNFALGLAAVFFAAPAFAMPPNHTVKLVVPVDISKMPYVNALTVGCRLNYPEGTVPTPQTYNRADLDFSGGEFHQNVEVVLTAPEGPAPIGYRCDLYVTPTDGTGGFSPVDPAQHPDAPAEHKAAEGTVPVSEISGTFGPLQIQAPQQQRLQLHKLQRVNPPPDH